MPLLGNGVRVERFLQSPVEAIFNATSQRKHRSTFDSGSPGRAHFDQWVDMEDFEHAEIESPYNQ